MDIKLRLMLNFTNAYGEKAKNKSHWFCSQLLYVFHRIPLFCLHPFLQEQFLYLLLIVLVKNSKAR
jgi:hypothetical protein